MFEHIYWIKYIQLKWKNTPEKYETWEDDKFWCATIPTKIVWFFLPHFKKKIIEIMAISTFAKMLKHYWGTTNVMDYYIIEEKTEKTFSVKIGTNLKLQ